MSFLSSMSMSRAEEVVHSIFRGVDITVNGTNEGDIQVHDQRFYQRVLSGGSLALGGSYMDSWWSSDKLDVFFTKFLSDPELRASTRKYWPTILNSYLAQLTNRQSRSLSVKSVHSHYDIGNDLYEPMLGRTMAYTCAYWNDAKTLDEAQDAKFDLVCRKIGLQPGMTVLDLGCGWGGFAYHAAKNYGAKVTGYTVSTEQVALGRELNKGLPVELKLEDYRDADGKFDRVVSIGLLEHVGCKNYREFMQVMSRNMKDDHAVGLFHTIGSNFSTDSIDPWINKYIFPNAMLPSISQLSKAMENIFVVEDWHNISAHYDLTLMAWNKSFQMSWPELEVKYGGERFRRMWEYYLLCCAGTFRSRANQLWQVVISKRGVPGGYQTVR